MAFDIDTTSPADSQIISAFPTSQRGVHTEIKSIVTAEHEEATGHHMIPSGDKTARDAESDPTEGQLWIRDDIATIDRYLSSAWGSQLGHGYGTLAARDALTKADLPNGYVFVVTDENYTAYAYDTTEGDWVELRPEPQSYTTRARANDNNQLGGGGSAWTDVTGCEVSITLPDDSRKYEMVADGVLEFYSAEQYIAARLTEKVGAAAEAGVGDPVSPMLNGTDNHYNWDSAHVNYVNSDVTGDGTVHIFKLQFAAGAASSTVKANPGQTFKSITNWSTLTVRLSPYIA